MRDKNGLAKLVAVTCAHFPVGRLERIVLVMRGKGDLPNYGLKMGKILAEQAPLMVYVTDEHWRILWANSAKALGSGYSTEELVGRQSPLRRYLGEQKPELLERIEEALAGAGQWEGSLYSRRRNGELYPIRARISQVRDLRPGEYSRIVTLIDISSIRETEHLLRRVSLYDPTTALPNRAFFEQEVNRSLGEASPERSRFYLLLIDIDSFALVNQALGYEAADRILKDVGKKLLKSVGFDKLLVRHESDMFALLVCDAQSSTDVSALVSRIQRAFRDPFTLDGNQLNLSLSIGISNYPEDGTSCDELMRKADVAVKRVKKRGGNSYTFYHAGEEVISQRFITMAGPLHQGLHKDEFRAAFQPIVDGRTWEVVAMEALARWLRPDGSIVGPKEFIPVAECSGAIRKIFECVLRHSCHQLLKLDEQGHPGLHASINLSPRQFSDIHLATSIVDVIRGEGLSPDRIYLEVTESMLMDDPWQNARILAELQNTGIKIVIDDFGTGYSSLSYLKHFDVDGIKLDQLFVRDIPRDAKSGKLVSMILAMGREMEIPVVAEGVETHAQADFLCKHRCDRLQGFLIAPPMLAGEFDLFLQSHSTPR